MSYIAMETLLITILLLLPIVCCEEVIPADKSQLDTWFNSQVSSPAIKTASVNSSEAVESSPKSIKVRADGSGDFKTVTDAIKSIPDGNTQRVIVSIGPGNYTEKIDIERTKPYITLYGDPNDNPILVFNGDAAKYGTVYSATLSAENDYFTANSSPRPDGIKKGAQAVALKAAGEFQSFYNCKFYGFQDTICDFKGKHLFKNCYIEGTVDFIFGSGTSLYLNSEIHIIPGDTMAIIAAQARSESSETTGFSFVHCDVTGTGGIAYLGRSWFPAPRVVYAYCELSDVVHPEGWSNNFHPEHNSTVYFGEYNNKGPGANFEKRASFAKKLNDGEAKKFISLGFIQAATWLRPPPSVKL